MSPLTVGAPRASRSASISRPRHRGGSAVSVIVPAYRPASEAHRLVESLLRQTLSPTRFEVIFCLNGPNRFASSRHYQDFAAEAPFAVRVLSTSAAGTSHALNLGIASARAPWVTFVDDDDALSPHFLEKLLELARMNVIPLATILDTHPDGSIAEQSDLGRAIADRAGRLVPAEEFARGLGFNAAKLVPTAWARQSPHSTSIRSGHDVAFFARLYSKHEFAFSIPSLAANATYYRTLTPLSLSRRLHDPAFAVDERIAVAASLREDIRASPARKHAVLHTLMRSQANFTKEFLAINPEAHRDVVTAAEPHRLGPVWWATVNQRPARRLVVSTCFAPFNDPSAVTVAKRIRSWGEPVDVVALDLSALRRRDESLSEMVAPFVRSLSWIRASIDFRAPSALEEFAALGWQTIASSLDVDVYDELYSRAMWPASHVLAALIKLERPSLRWTAEFSDSLSRTVEGDLRPGPAPDGALLRRLLDEASTVAGGPLPADTIFEFAESIAYGLADRVVFTNDNQREYMLSHIPDEAVRDRVRRRSSIEPQPIPDRHLYRSNALAPLPPSGRIRLGYFGTFYANRSVGDVIDALESSSADVRREFELHLYTPPSADLDERLRDCPPDVEIRTFEPLDYLSFLGRAREYDCLVVADARTVGTHLVNPYLPSKVSDYRGSGRPVWGLVEPGSPLSRMALDFQSILGDTESARAALLRLARDLTSGSVTPREVEGALHG